MGISFVGIREDEKRLWRRECVCVPSSFSLLCFLILTFVHFFNEIMRGWKRLLMDAYKTRIKSNAISLQRLENESVIFRCILMFAHKLNVTHDHLSLRWLMKYNFFCASFPILTTVLSFLFLYASVHAHFRSKKPTTYIKQMNETDNWRKLDKTSVHFSIWSDVNFDDDDYGNANENRTASTLSHLRQNLSFILVEATATLKTLRTIKSKKQLSKFNRIRIHFWFKRGFGEWTLFWCCDFLEFTSNGSKCEKNL